MFRSGFHATNLELFLTQLSLTKLFRFYNFSQRYQLPTTGSRQNLRKLKIEQRENRATRRVQSEVMNKWVIFSLHNINFNFATVVCNRLTHNITVFLGPLVLKYCRVGTFARSGLLGSLSVHFLSFGKLPD